MRRAGTTTSEPGDSREIGERRGEAIVIANLGEVHFALGNFEGARARYERSLALSRESGTGGPRPGPPGPSAGYSPSAIATRMPWPTSSNPWRFPRDRGPARGGKGHTQPGRCIPLSRSL